jgi:hypothetical protein
MTPRQHKEPEASTPGNHQAAFFMTTTVTSSCYLGLVSERKDSLVNRVRDRGCALLLMPNYQFLQSSEAEFFIAVFPFKNAVAVHHQDRARLETYEARWNSTSDTAPRMEVHHGGNARDSIRNIF